VTAAIYDLVHSVSWHLKTLLESFFFIIRDYQGAGFPVCDTLSCWQGDISTSSIAFP